MAYWILKVLLTPVFYLLWRVKVEGREHVPAHGPAVLAANHQSFCDSFFLPLVLRRRVTYVAKAEYFDNWRTAWFFRAAGQIPMQPRAAATPRSGPSTRPPGCSTGATCWASIPRGPGPPTARLHKGHTGVARLSLAVRCAGHPGGHRRHPGGAAAGEQPDATVPPVTVRFGPPLAYERNGRTVITGSARNRRRSSGREGPARGTSSVPRRPGRPGCPGSS